MKRSHQTDRSLPTCDAGLGLDSSASRRTLRARVERVAEAVADDVQREHRQHDHQAGDDRQQRLRVEQLDPDRDHRSPGGVGRLHAGAEERERRLEEHVVGDRQGEEDDDRRGEVGEDLAEHHPQRAGALGDRRFDELFLAAAARTSPRIGRAMYGTVKMLMMKIGIQSEPPAISSGPDLQPAERERDPHRDPDQQHRQRPEHVEGAGDHGCRPSRGSSRRAGRAGSPAAVVMIAEPNPTSSEVRPPYISRTISSRPRRLSAPRKNLPPAPNHCGPIGLPSTLTTSCLFAVDGDLFQRVRLVRAGVGDVVGPQRRRQHEEDDQDEERRERRPRPGCGGTAAERGPTALGLRSGSPAETRWPLAPAALAPGYLNSKLVR